MIFYKYKTINNQKKYNLMIKKLKIFKTKFKKFILKQKFKPNKSFKIH